MAKLCPKGKAAAKRKFKVYPSAYANMYASGVCSGKITPGGKNKNRVKRSDGNPNPSGVHHYEIEQSSGDTSLKIEVTDFGCGYDFAPKVTIAAPENGEQAVASFPYPENSVLSQQDIVANTMSYYS